MATLLNCNPQTVYRMGDKGLLGSVKVGNLRRFYFLEGKDKTMAKKMTQRDRVLMYIGEFGSISRREAFLDLGIVELSSRIGELEAMGVRFNRQTETSQNRYGESVSYTRYSLAKKEERTDA